jgi:hypothetical protein
MAVAATKSKGHEYKRLQCAWHRGRGPDVCGNSITMRVEHVAGPLLGFVRDELLNPALVTELVERVNRRAQDKVSKDDKAAQRKQLHAEAIQVEREMERLIALVEAGTAVEKVQAKLATKQARLTTIRAQVAAMTEPAPASELHTMTEADVRARLSNVWEEIKDLDPDRARLALGRIFEKDHGPAP